MRWYVNTLDWISVVLVLAGAINWGLVGLFKLEIISAVFGVTVARVIFMLVGAAGLHTIYNLGEFFYGDENEALAEHPLR